MKVFPAHARRAVPWAGALLLCACAGAPPMSTNDPQSAPEVQGEPSELANLREAAEALFRARRFEPAREGFLALAEAAARVGDRAQQVEGLALAARMETLLARVPEARARLAQALALASPAEPLGWSRCLLVRGIVEREEGHPTQARVTFEEAYAYCRARGLELRAVDAAHFVALGGDLETSLEWTSKALRAAEAAGDARWQGVLWNNLGWSYSEAGRHEEAYTALVEARRFHRRGADARAAQIADWSVACAARRLGRFDEARALLGPVLAWAEQRARAEPGPDAAEWLGLTQRELFELAWAQDRPAEALAQLELALAQLAAAGMAEWGAAEFAELERRALELRAAQGEAPPR